MKPSPQILQFAEEPQYELPEPPLPSRTVIRPTFTLHMSPAPTQAFLSRVRTTAAGLDATIEEARTILHAHGYTACGWYVGPSCRPEGLVDRLKERGFAPATRMPFEPVFTSMVLTDAPTTSAVSPGIEARRVRSFDEFVTAVRVVFAAAGESEDEVASWVKAAPAFWESPNGVAQMTHIGFADGQIAGVGFVNYGNSAILLGGAAVLPDFRGRGVYRALLASRWRDAVETGKPALVIQAGAMSRPILERCGFQTVCQVDVLLDPALG